MSKKFYIISSVIVILGISLGVFYLQVLRPGAQELPKDVTLETAFGGEYDFNQANGKAKLVEFMYTNCPDVCPITSLEMSLLKNQLTKENVFGDQVEFITITIDPKRDTINKMEDYANRFEVNSDNDGWHFLRGNETDTKKLPIHLDFYIEILVLVRSSIQHTSISSIKMIIY